MRVNAAISVLALLIALCSCSYDGLENFPSPAGGPVTVGFAISADGQAATRSAAGADGLSTAWSPDDAIALWATQGTGFALDGVPFSIYSITDEGAFFTSELDAPMPSGTYSYFASYPVPVSVDGTTATFVVPTLQDGRSGGGEDIMIAAPASASALVPIDWMAAVRPELSLAMDHKLHRLRFYTMDTRLEGEEVQRLEVDFPRPVAGRVNVDFTDPTAAMAITEGASGITVKPESPVTISASGQRSYITSSIVPTSFQDGESMTVRLYTDTKLAKATIPLKSREFAAGHSTPVRIIPSSIGSFCRVFLDVVSNNLGESVQSITLSAPDGCKWSDSGGATYVYNPGTDIDAGHSFVLEFEDEAAFRTLSGKAVTVTYDSEHVTISENITIGDLSGKYSTRLRLNVPYLLYEDFSSVGSFSSNDAYKTSSAGDKSAYSFLEGWTGGRIGAEAGKCIRIACRRETSADYDARVDSAPLRGILKKPADLSVEFDYGANNEFGGIPIIVDGNVGQSCYIGYVTSTKAYSSKSTDGTFESGNSFYVKEYTGSWDHTPNSDSYILRNVPVSKTVRISWRTEVEHQAGTTNTTAWLYLDNIRIKISKE